MVEIICCGLGRTGTLSTVSALRKLGYKPYHMFEVMKEAHNTNSQKIYKDWAEAFRLKHLGDSEGCKKVLKTILKDFNVITDHPACNFYQELYEMYPKALVILTVRDSAEIWADSVKSTIGLVQNFEGHWFYKYLVWFGPAPYGMHHIGNYLHWTPTNNFKHPHDWVNEKVLVQRYNNYNDKVENYFKNNENFITYNLKQGWEPFCKLLNIPIPEYNYPRINDRKDMQNYTDTCKLIKSVPIIFIISAILLIYSFYWTSLIFFSIPFIIRSYTKYKFGEALNMSDDEKNKVIDEKMETNKTYWRK